MQIVCGLAADLLVADIVVRAGVDSTWCPRTLLKEVTTPWNHRLSPSHLVRVRVRARVRVRVGVGVRVRARVRVSAAV